MNNEELKKKILAIVRGAMLEADELPFIETTDNIADALIAAGIVDKSDYASMKETAVRYKAEVSKAGATVKEAEAEANRYEMLYKLQNRDMALAERRAHDAEHRAAMAERAIDLILTREKDLRCIHSFTNCDKNCELCWEGYFSKQKQGYLEQAEKELAEERKDD